MQDAIAGYGQCLRIAVECFGIVPILTGALVPEVLTNCSQVFLRFFDVPGHINRHADQLCRGQSADGRHKQHDSTCENHKSTDDTPQEGQREHQPTEQVQERI